MNEFLNSPEARAQAEKSKQQALKSIATLKPTKRTFTINGLEYLTAETIEILKQRAMEWFDENPFGEPMYSRNDGYQFVIHTNQLMRILEISESTAQLLLRICRKVLGKVGRAYVSVKEFCKLNYFDEEDFRKALRGVEPDLSMK